MKEQLKKTLFFLVYIRYALITIYAFKQQSLPSSESEESFTSFEIFSTCLHGLAFKMWETVNSLQLLLQC